MNVFRINCANMIYRFVCILFLWHYQSSAQSISGNDNGRHWWWNAGLGGSSIGLSFGISHSIQKGRGIASVRFIHSQEFNLLGPSPEESIWDIGLLYGINARSLYGHISVSSGISVVRGVKRGALLSSGWLSSKYEEQTFFTVGLPIEGQLLFIPSPLLGIGLYGFANINAKKSFIGVLACVQIGKLR